MSAGRFSVVQRVADVSFRIGTAHDTEVQAHIAAREFALSEDADVDVFVDGPGMADVDDESDVMELF
jgi:hypothetical protein